MWLEVIIGLSMLWTFWKVLRRDPLSTLPGPRALPVLGNALQLMEEGPPIQLLNWAKKYGPVYKIHAMGKQYIVVTGSRELKDMTVKLKDDFSSRSGVNDSYRLKVWTLDYSDLIFTQYSSTFKLKKQLFMKGLKLHDIKPIEKLTQEIANGLITDFQSMGNVPFHPKEFVYGRIVQFLYVVLFGKMLDLKSEECKKIMLFDEKSFDLFTVTGSGPILDMFPWSRFFGNKTYKNLKMTNDIAEELFGKWIKETHHQDCWFAELQQQVDTLPYFSQKMMMMFVMDFFFAGAITTTATLLGFLNTLVHHPQVQQKLQEEIDTNCKGRDISFRDRENLPYAHACLLEILRYTCVVCSIWRTATRDTELSGIFIPKDTTFFANIWGLHHDEHYFPEPFCFKPERFLTEEGMVVPPGEGQRKHMLPFGAGTRGCAGETLAMTRLFVMICNIARHCTILPGTNLEEQTGNHPCDYRGSSLHPQTFYIRVQQRL